MRTLWTGVDESIAAKICYKLFDDNSRKILCRSVIRPATRPGITNLQVDPIKPLRNDAIIDTEKGTMLDEFMFLTDFETPLSRQDEEHPVDPIPANTKSKRW